MPTYREQLANLLVNVDYEIQCAQIRASGANVHSLAGISASLHDYKFFLDNGRFEQLYGPNVDKVYAWTTVLVNQLLTRLRLISNGMSGNEASKEAKKLYDPGPFPVVK